MLTDFYWGDKGASVSSASLKTLSNKVKFKNNISWICQQWKYIFKFDIYINPNVRWVVNKHRVSPWKVLSSNPRVKRNCWVGGEGNRSAIISSIKHCCGTWLRLVQHLWMVEEMGSTLPILLLLPLTCITCKLRVISNISTDLLHKEEEENPLTNTLSLSQGLWTFIFFKESLLNINRSFVGH